MAKILSLLLTASLLATASAHAAPDTPISEAELAADIRIMAGDAFEGRGPGTAGEARTIAHIVGTWATLGLIPLADSVTPWLQPVPLVEISQIQGRMEFVVRGVPVRLSDTDMALRARVSDVTLDALPLVFAGYGVDGSGQIAADVAGKVVMILGGDVPFIADGPSLRERREMLANAGAAAVIAVADPSMPWMHVRAAYPVPITRLADAKADVPFDAMISLRGFDELLGKLGRKGSVLRGAAATADYRAEDLPIQTNIQASAAVKNYDSHNVVASFAGAKPDGKAVIVMGHWDHWVCAALMMNRIKSVTVRWIMPAVLQ